MSAASSSIHRAAAPRLMRWVAYFLRIRAPNASRENLLLPTVSTLSSIRISLLYRASTDLAMELQETLAINFGQKNPPPDIVERGIFVA
jgi:hypothetical protein